MSTGISSSQFSRGKHQLAWNAAHVEVLSKDQLKEVLRYTVRLAELYEMFILSKGIRYLWEADQYIEEHKGENYPFL